MTGSEWLRLLGIILLAAGWCVWWLWGVNWHKLWTALAKGAWVPALLLAALAAMVWNQLQSLEWASVPSGWWQAAITIALLAVALFCGWLQGYFHWSPAEISVEPPAHTPAHDQGHAHH